MYFLDTHNTLWYLAVDSWYVIARCRSKAVSPVSHSSDRGGIFFSLQRWVVSVCLKWSWHWLIRQDVGQNGTEQHNQPVHGWYLHRVMYSWLKIMTNESFRWFLLVKTLYATRWWRGGSVLQVFEVRCAALHDVEGNKTNDYRMSSGKSATCTDALPRSEQLQAPRIAGTRTIRHILIGLLSHSSVSGSTSLLEYKLRTNWMISGL